MQDVSGGKVVVISNEPVTNYSSDQYKATQSSIPMIKNQISYFESTGVQVHRFRILEIINDSEVKEVCSFLYPKNKETMFFVNEDASIMVEWLDKLKYYMYRSFPILGRDGEVKWELVRMLDLFTPEYFSTNFTYNVRYEKDLKKIII